MTESAKLYLQVNVDFTENGEMLPRTLIWKDRVYPIDRIKKVRPAHAERAGGVGDRYTVMVNGRERYLFFEHNTDAVDKDVGRWFVERKE